MTDFATSDLHLFHENITQNTSREILPGFNRPFANCEEMHDRIITDWNAQVKKSDRVFIIGDLTFGKSLPTAAVLEKLHGQKFLVKGNHDSSKVYGGYAHRIAAMKDYMEKIFETERHGKQRVCMFHFPIMSWSSMSRGSWHFHGHSHGNLVLPPSHTNARIIDVGVDATSAWTGHWGPVSFDDLMDKRISEGVSSVAVEGHRKIY